MRLGCATTALLLLLGSCRRLPSEPEVPAVITNPTQQSRAALTAAVSKALNGAPVSLADDALTLTSTLVIERVRPRDSSGLAMNGRERDVPDRFQLVKIGDECVLVQLGPENRFPLPDVTCSRAVSK